MVNKTFVPALILILSVILIVVLSRGVVSESSDSVVFAGLKSLVETSESIDDESTDANSTSIKVTSLNDFEAADENVLSQFSHELPNGFQEEVISASNYSASYVSDNKKVVGLFSSKNAEDAFGQIKEEMESKEWVCIESGVENTATFQKAKGLYRWAFVQVEANSDGSLLLFNLESIKQ